MIPRRPSNLFRSRRAALLWAAGVMLTAVATVGVGPTPGDVAADGELEALRVAINAMS